MWLYLESSAERSSAPASVETSLSTSGSRPRFTVKSIHSAKQCFCHGWPTVVCQALLSGMTSERLTALQSGEPSTSSSRAGRAKTCRLPAVVQAWTASAADFGEKYFASSLKFDRSSCTWKTSQGYDARLTELSETWPRWGMTRAGRMYQRSNQAPLTVASDGGALLPTPTKSDYGSSQNGSNRTRPSAGTLSLSTRAKRGVMPTPAKIWPTPTKTDSRLGGGRQMSASKGRAHAGTSLTDAVREHTGNASACLNPEFSEWLMGLSLQWTAPDESFLSATSALAPSATDGAGHKPDSPSSCSPELRACDE
jgi:hypothetical protein